jgi:hypothetical protein
VLVEDSVVLTLVSSINATSAPDHRVIFLATVVTART